MGSLSVLNRINNFSTINASIFTGEQSFFFFAGGGGLWEVRVTVVLFVNSFSPTGSSLCASSGLVPFGVRKLGVKSLEGLTLFIEYPFPHAAIACCTRCVGSYGMGFGVLLLSLALWRFYRPCDHLRVFQSR